jgi:protein O-GlcNAc transferase
LLTAMSDTDSSIQTNAIAELIRDGMAHHRAGQLVLAERAYRHALALDPGHPEALALCGMIAGQAGQLRAAVELFEHALKRDPRNADIHHNLGETWRHLGDALKALQCFERAVTLNPNHIEAHRGAAEASFAEAERREAAGRWGDAVGFKRRAVQLLIATAERFVESNSLSAASDALRRVVEIDPNNAQAWALYGSTLIKSYPSRAVPALRRAIELDPNKAWIHIMLCNALVVLRRDREAQIAWDAARAAPDFSDSWVALMQLHILPLYEGGDMTEIFARHRAWGDAMVARQGTSPPRFKNVPDPERLLRIGYVSPDFHIHSVAFFLEPLLRAHDRQRFEVFCYSGVPKLGEDRMTAWLKAHASHWRSTVSMDDEALRQHVRSDQIDILIDLTGHFADTRLRAFAAKPAPVTASWLGYPATTGLPTIDWRITDAIADPPGAERFYSEKLMRLPNGFLCFRPLADAPPVTPLPAMTRDHLTFGSFNNQLKINRSVFAVWSRILTAVPDARLFIKIQLLEDEGVAARLRDGFAAEGIDVRRVELHPWISGMRDHLAAYGEIDIALDPFPYNGTTTTCEALWMGVPAVTLIGDRHAGRVGLDLLSRVGLERFAAPDIDTYVQIAAALAEDRAQLAELRAGLRERVAHSPLCDAPRFAREFESALRAMWRQWCESTG